MAVFLLLWPFADIIIYNERQLMALAHKVVVLSCCAVAYLNPDKKTKRCSCSKLNVSEVPELALAFAADLDGI